MTLILAGDIGGTKCNLGLFESRRGGLAVVQEQSFPSKNYSNLEQVVAAFMTAHPATLSAASFGVACPILDGEGRMPNLSWLISRRSLQGLLKMEAVGLINDLSAMALGIDVLPASAFAVLNEGKTRPEGTRVVIAAGTGLGEASAVWNGRRRQVIPSEGGHADFAPRTETEIGLLRDLIKKYGRVSWERVLSGPGLLNIYEFLRRNQPGSEPPALRQRLKTEDPGAVITELALAAQDPVCVQTIELFISAYGAEAGNLALKFFAEGGVYLGGGIAPKILSKLKEGAFMKAFVDKGRLSDVVAAMPVRVILDTCGPLYGAAVHAFSLLSAAASPTEA